jgi:ribosomal protein S18 acetylase RimI-like enzyme
MAVVRYAEPADGPSMGAVHVRAWQVGYRGLLPDRYLDELDAAFRAERWTAALRRGRGAGECVTREGTTTALLLEDGGAVAGIAAVNRARDGSEHAAFGEVAMVNVAPEQWGRGFGRQLLAASLDELRWQGFTDAVLWVLDTNQRARAFYERAGWSADGADKEEDDRGFRLRQVRYRRTVATEDDDLRLGATADVDAVLDLYEEAARWLTDRSIPQWLPGGLPAERVQDLLERGEVISLHTARRMVACCILLETDNGDRSGRVHDLIVARSHAGQGLGRRLLQRAERRVAERGGTEVRLECVTTNTRLRRYYERAGYRYIGETDFGRPDWMACAVYGKDLGATAGPGPTA